MANAYELQTRKLYPDKFVELSRLFIYYNARQIFGEPAEDTGTTVRAGIKALKLHGVCAETIWPYDVSKFSTRPSAEAYDDAKSRTIETYTRLKTKHDAMAALSDGYPVVIAVIVFSEFMHLSQANSTVIMPSKSSPKYGGHAMCLVGYNLEEQVFLAKNSFGTGWGDQGYCWIPFKYVDEYVFEQWAFKINPARS